MSITQIGAGPLELDYGPACRRAHLQFQPSASFALTDTYADAHGFLSGARTGVGVYEFEYEHTDATFAQAQANLQGPSSAARVTVDVNLVTRKLIVTVLDAAGSPADLATHKINAVLRTRRDV